MPCAPGCETCDGPNPCVITLNWEQRGVVLGVSALIMCGIPLLIWFTVQYRDVKVCAFDVVQQICSSVSFVFGYTRYKLSRTQIEGLRISACMVVLLSAIVLCFPLVCLYFLRAKPLVVRQLVKNSKTKSLIVFLTHMHFGKFKTMYTVISSHSTFMSRTPL